MTESEFVSKIGGMYKIADILGISVPGAYKKFKKKTFKIHDVVKMSEATGIDEYELYSILKNM